MARTAAGATPATIALTRAGVAFTLHRYSSAGSGPKDRDRKVRGDEGARGYGTKGYGVEAARALGADPARLLKTLVVDADQRLVVAIVAVADQLDLKAFAHAVGAKKAALAAAVEAQRSTGYVVGGISPLGQRTALPTVIEESATHFPTVLVSAGRRGLQVELDPADLIAVTGATVAVVRR